jgi:hypothetical protein
MTSIPVAAGDPVVSVGEAVGDPAVVETVTPGRGVVPAGFVPPAGWVTPWVVRAVPVVTGGTVRTGGAFVPGAAGMVPGRVGVFEPVGGATGVRLPVVAGEPRRTARVGVLAPAAGLPPPPPPPPDLGGCCWLPPPPWVGGFGGAWVGGPFVAAASEPAVGVVWTPTSV